MQVWGSFQPPAGLPAVTDLVHALQCVQTSTTQMLLLQLWVLYIYFSLSAANNVVRVVACVAAWLHKEL